MATNKKKITDELTVPKMPGAIDNNALKTAATGVQNARNAVTNMTYDTFKSGDLYKGLQRDYQQQGQQAMKDTLGQVAARTGGMASSYATSAANQSYNNYMTALEDAARSAFNEEYARKRDAYDMAQREYDTAYGEYRDKVGDAWDEYNAQYNAHRDRVEDAKYDNEWQYKVDQDKKAAGEEAKLQAQEDVMAIWQSGGTPSYELLLAAGWADSTMPAGADGNVLNVTGAAYKSQVDNASKEQSQADIYDEINARIANGESLEDIANDYGIGDDGDPETVDKTWKEVTGISEAEWQQIYNENEVGGYTYPKTAEGANNIVASLTNSASLSLSDKDQKNFDYIYGDGAYDAVQKFIFDITPDNTRADSFKNSKNFHNMSREVFDAQFDSLCNELADKVPGISVEQVIDIVEKANPEIFKAATDADYPFWKRER